MSEGKKVYRYHGKIVTKKQYDSKVRAQELGKSNKGRKIEKTQLPTEEETPKNFDCPDDERIVSLKYLGKQLWCSSCKEALSLDHIESERYQGFVSILLVRCHKCSVIKEIVTGKQSNETNDKESTHFEINFKAVQGIMQSGITYTQLNKFCSIMNIPCPERAVFHRHEDKVEKEMSIHGLEAPMEQED